MDGKTYYQKKHKELSETVKKLENERSYTRSYDHKQKLQEAKKRKLLMKDLLDKFDPDEHQGGVESFG
jgi:hypothetical protein